MRIAHVVSTFYPRLGGMGVVVYDESKALVLRGHSVSVFTMRYGSETGSEAVDGFMVERLKPILRRGDGGVVRFGDRFKDFDIVHLHLPWYGSAWLAARAARQARVPLVVTLHMEGQMTGMRQIYKKISDEFFLGTILRNANQVFLVSKTYFARSAYLKNLRADKISELPNPVDSNIFTLGTRDRAILGNLALGEGKVILFVGNLMPVKRLDLLLRALAEGDSDWRLAVVGGGYSEKKFRKMAEDLKIGDKINFFGSMARAELSRFYRAADCVVVPSDSESFSLVAAEAMASGTLVIKSHSEGNQASEDDGIFKFLAGSATDLIAKLCLIFSMSEEERKNLGSKVSPAVQNKFSLAAHVDLLENAYFSQHVI
ncbi:MAG: glycosyltransferase family 4 protein [Candidatus Magasanikbacteria bacterium]|nr:glycosyltransferase family 4 protein [Candidatus Magasanikbacteria bacterium]